MKHISEASYYKHETRSLGVKVTLPVILEPHTVVLDTSHDGYRDARNFGNSVRTHKHESFAYTGMPVFGTCMLDIISGLKV